MERPRAPRRPERRRLGSSAALSLLLHLGLLLALVLLARRRMEAPQWLPPPSVQMVFQGGHKGPISVPNKAPPSTNLPASPPPVPVAPPAPALTPPTPPAPRSGLIAPQPVPPPLPAVPPAPAPPGPTQTPRTLPAPPRPSAPVAPPPPLTVQAPAPRLPLPPASHAAPAQAPSASRPARTASPPARFPAPTAFSLGAAHPAPARPTRAAPARPPSRGIDLSFAPQGAGANRLSIDGLLDRDGVGPDWSNAFSAWLARHSYYPHDAGLMGEEGDVVVDFTVAKDGTVSGLRLVSSSGHPLLDMATLSMFRGAHLPPLPPQNGARMPVHFTMRYVIVRR